MFGSDLLNFYCCRRFTRFTSLSPACLQPFLRTTGKAKIFGRKVQPAVGFNAYVIQFIPTFELTIMEAIDIRKQFEIKELELNALLEITQAINSNLPEESLYKIYNFTLRSNLNINKLALFVLDDDWYCKTHFGGAHHYNRVKLLQEFKTIQDITHLREFRKCEFTEFDIIIPVTHKSTTLALVFVGGLEKYDDDYENGAGIKFIQALSNIIIVAIENKKLA